MVEGVAVIVRLDIAEDWMWGVGRDSTTAAAEYSSFQFQVSELPLPNIVFLVFFSQLQMAAERGSTLDSAVKVEGTQLKAPLRPSEVQAVILSHSFFEGCSLFQEARLEAAAQCLSVIYSLCHHHSSLHSSR